MFINTLPAFQGDGTMTPGTSVDGMTPRTNVTMTPMTPMRDTMGINNGDDFGVSQVIDDLVPQGTWYYQDYLVPSTIWYYWYYLVPDTTGTTWYHLVSDTIGTMLLVYVFL